MSENNKQYQLLDTTIVLVTEHSEPCATKILHFFCSFGWFFYFQISFTEKFYFFLNINKRLCKSSRAGPLFFSGLYLRNIRKNFPTYCKIMFKKVYKGLLCLTFLKEKSLCCFNSYLCTVSIFCTAKLCVISLLEHNFWKNKIQNKRKANQVQFLFFWFFQVTDQ